MYSNKTLGLHGYPMFFLVGDKLDVGANSSNMGAACQPLIPSSSLGHAPLLIHLAHPCVMCPAPSIPLSLLFPLVVALPAPRRVFTRGSQAQRGCSLTPYLRPPHVRGMGRCDPLVLDR